MNPDTPIRPIRPVRPRTVAPRTGRGAAPAGPRAPAWSAPLALALSMALVGLAGPGSAWAQHREGPGERAAEPGWRGGERGLDRRDRADRQDNPWRAPVAREALRPGAPAPGVLLRTLPAEVRWVAWGGQRYYHHDGVWFRAAPQGWLVVRPPVGLYVRDLPLWRTVVVVGGVSYLLVNGVYWREVPDGGYEVVAPPLSATGSAAAAAAAAGGNPGDAGLPRQYVYPRQGQSADQQASDEYECHRWAVGQSGFDPSAAATSGAAGASPAAPALISPPAATATTTGTTGTTGATGATGRRDDYQRARAACLDGRGYTVR